MTSDSQYNSIRPYIGEEIAQGAERLSRLDDFLSLFSSLLRVDRQYLVDSLQGVATRIDFQEKCFSPIVRRILELTSQGVSVSGMEQLEKGRSYLFVSNHRDIILDSAILNLLLSDRGLLYCQAAIGSNLLLNDWVTDLVKLDACFVIERGLPVKEMVTSAGLRSHYIRDVIQERNNSVWIAQKEGRTKDGNDRTQHSLLKMFRMSGPKDFAENFRELHIVPVAISYEWEPCDDLKSDELYRKSTGEYQKTPAADMTGMYQGLADTKGRIHFSIGKPIDHELEAMNALPNHGDRIAALANLIDHSIHTGYMLWPNNYIAYDLLHGTARFTSSYSPEEKEMFIHTMRKRLDKLSGNRSILNNIYLGIYAHPLENKLAAQHHQVP